MLKNLFNSWLETEKKKLQNLPKLLAVVVPIWIALHLWERKLTNELIAMEIPQEERIV